MILTLPLSDKGRAIRPFVALLLLLIMASSSIHAEQQFDYVRNPTGKDMSTFSGAINDRITTTATPKTAYFYMQTALKDTLCATQNVSLGGIVIVPNLGVKGYNNCLNFSPEIVVSIAIDNPDFGITPYARIGDYNNATNHISVIPYRFNAWQDVNKQADQNNANMNQLFVAQDRNPLTKKLDQSKLGDIGNWVLDEGTFPALYEWKINNKKGVCSNQILTALSTPSTYYSHPSELVLSSFGNITANNCRSLMFPSTTATDRVNSLIDVEPQLINSLYYDESIQYHSYPFTIRDIQLKCYDHGKLVGQRGLEIERQQQSRQGSNTGWTLRTRFNDETLNNGIQDYPWTTLRDGTTLYSPANIELMQKDFSLKCPAGTNYYTASAVLLKNYMYRHKSPMDATFYWSDIFPGTSGSAIESTFATHASDEAIFITQTGEINILPPPINNTFPLGGNQDKNKINETNSTKAGTGSNGTYGPSPSNGNNGVAPCIDCMQNLTAGYGGNSTAANSPSGTSAGGSSIQTGVDDSAVTDLAAYAKGQNDIQTKATFMEKLIAVGIIILTTVIVLYSMFALLAIIFFFIALFSIPQKMKKTIRDLFNAGAGK